MYQIIVKFIMKLSKYSVIVVKEFYSALLYNFVKTLWYYQL